MKKNLITLVVILCTFLSMEAQSQPQNASWFTVKEVTSKVWAIDDHKAVNIYLVEGSDSAMVIDTGMGVSDLLAQVRKLTSKPLIVVNTHGHPDHTGANYQFERIYIHSADSADARACSLKSSRESAARNMLRGAVPAEGDLFKGRENHFRFVTVKNGHIFNLGNRRIEVIETPGHTPGSICLLDKEDKLLFTGDNDNTAVWLFLPNCTPLSVYYKTLQSLSKRIPEFTTLLPGHGIPKKSDFILEQVECVRSILDHTCVSESYDTFAGKARLCQYKTASVAYNPDNL
jgi:hydroxyacylglutathione hydrolase